MDIRSDPNVPFGVMVLLLPKKDSESHDDWIRRCYAAYNLGPPESMLTQPHWSQKAAQEIRDEFFMQHGDWPESTWVERIARIIREHEESNER